jgi:hypothetical protein
MNNIFKTSIYENAGVLREKYEAKIFNCKK